MLPRKAKPDTVTFFARQFPSANFAVVHGLRPIMIDSGFGSDAAATLFDLEAAGTHPRDLQCIANTHYHVDHVGGNAAFQREHHVPIAAHRHDALMVNAADPESCSADYLGQPVEQYTVDIFLQPGAVLETGTTSVQVIGTPGHTLGHLSFFVEDGTLIAGDLFYENDIAALLPFREGVGAVYRLIDSLQSLADFPALIKRVLPGHGPAILKPYDAIDTALARLERWLDEPEKIAWHNMKRAAVYRLMIAGPLRRSDFELALSHSHWLRDYAAYVFDAEPSVLAIGVCDEIIRSGAVLESSGRLSASAPHTSVPAEWLASIPPVRTWKAPDMS